MKDLSAGWERNMNTMPISVRIFTCEKFDLRQGAAVSLAITSDNKYIVSGSLDGTVALFNTQNKEIKTTRAHRGKPFFVDKLMKQPC